MAGAEGSLSREKKNSQVRREMEDLYALDFDGVICDSCEETALSAVKVISLRLTNEKILVKFSVFFFFFFHKKVLLN